MYVIVIFRNGQSTQSVMTIFCLLLNNNVVIDKCFINGSLSQSMMKLFLMYSCVNHCSQRSQRSSFLTTQSWKCISHVFMKIRVISVVTGEIIFYLLQSLKPAYSVMKLYLVFKISVVSVVSNGIIFHVVLNIGVVSVVSDKTILHAVSKISVVNVFSDEIISHLVLKVLKMCVVSVVTGEIIFYVLQSLKSAQSVQRGMKLYLEFKISVVNVVSNVIIFHIVMDISVVSLVSDKTILHSVSKVSVVTDEFFYYMVIPGY